MYSCNLWTTESATTAATLGSCKVTETLVMAVFLSMTAAIFFFKEVIFSFSSLVSSIVPDLLFLKPSDSSSSTNNDLNQLIAIPGSPIT